jgi:hypothetical protein
MKNTTTPTTRLPSIPVPAYTGDRDRNEANSVVKFRRQGVHAGYPCIICNTFTGPNPTGYLHICDGGGMVADPNSMNDTDHDESGCLASYPIGASCLKRYPELRPYVFQITVSA